MKSQATKKPQTRTHHRSLTPPVQGGGSFPWGTQVGSASAARSQPAVRPVVLRQPQLSPRGCARAGPHEFSVRRAIAQPSRE